MSVLTHRKNRDQGKHDQRTAEPEHYTLVEHGVLTEHAVSAEPLVGIPAAASRVRVKGEPRRPPSRPRALAGHRVTADSPPAGPGSCAPARAVRRWPALAAAAVLTGLVVAGLGLFAESMVPSAPVPERTALIAVAPGESLWEVAARFAPGSDIGAVVERIRLLNGLNGEVAPVIQAGLSLEVPYAGEPAGATGFSPVEVDFAPAPRP